MPVVYVHGVATRDTSTSYEQSWDALRSLLRRYIAPVISDRPDRVAVEVAYWGHLAASMPLGGINRPRGPLLGMGAEDDAAVSAALMAEFADSLDAAGEPDLGSPAGLLAPSGPESRAGALPLDELEPDELSDLLVAAMPESAAGEGAAAAWAIAADDVARDSQTRQILQRCGTVDEQADQLMALVDQRYQGPTDPLTGMGAGDSWRSTWLSRVAESASRVAHAPGFVLSRALAEARGPLNDRVTTFIGDVFVYLAGRGEPGAPGPIPKAVLDVMRVAASRRLTADEPMVLLTHSMGGQIAYDLVTSFLPDEPDAATLRVDFWCATASQVGLFQELDLFVTHPPRASAAPAPSPAQLGYWWNVWDYNDFLSYTAAGVVSGVDDESYSSGLSVLSAHSGYLRRPSFYRRFADKLEAAHRLGYGR